LAIIIVPQSHCPNGSFIILIGIYEALQVDLLLKKGSERPRITSQFFPVSQTEGFAPVENRMERRRQRPSLFYRSK
jgi:hypothetical protein